MFGFKDRFGYRVIVYKNIDGEVFDRVVSQEEAVDLSVDGWSLSPSQAHPDPAMRGNSEYREQVDMIGSDRMRMLNLPVIKDKEVLAEVATRWLGIKLNPKHNVRSMKRRMVNRAIAKGVWEGSGSDGDS